MRRRRWLGLAFSLLAAGCGGGVKAVPVASTPITSPGQSALYKLRFVNQSGLSGTALIVPQSATAPFVNLVWWAAQSQNGSTQSYSWYDAYAVFFSTTTQLLPGVVIDVSSSQLPIDSGSVATLTTFGGSGSPYFSVQNNGVQGFGLATDATIANGVYSEGFSMNNVPLQAMPAVREQSQIWNPPALDIGFTTDLVLQGEVLGYELFDHTPLNLSVDGGAVTVTYTAAHTFVTSLTSR